LGGLDLCKIPHGSPKIRDILNGPFIEGFILIEILAIFLIDEIHEPVHIGTLDPLF
jgi:hypothetical protein